MSFFRSREVDAPGTRVLSRRFLQLRVKSITGRWHSISAKSTDKVSAIKAEIRANEGPGDYRGKGLMFVHDSPEWQNVIYQDEILLDDRTLQSYGITSNSELHIVRRRRALPQAKGCGKCLESPCIHQDAEHQYAPDMHWSSAYGWEFPGEKDYETNKLLAPEFEFQLPPGGLKAQRLRTGPQHHRGDVSLVMQTEAEVKKKRDKELDLRSSDEEDGHSDESEPEDDLRVSGEERDAESSGLLASSSKVEPDKDEDSDRDSEVDGPAARNRRRKQCCRPKRWIRNYCHQVGLGFKQVVAGWTSVFFKPAESEFEPSEQFQEAIEKSIDTETCLNLSYQDLGHPYQYQYFIKMVPYFENLRELNLSMNRLSALPKFDMPFLEALSLSHNRFDDLSGVPALPELKVLDVSCNNLETAAGIYKFQKLERLLLKDNPIEYKYLYVERVKARAPSSLAWLDGKPFEPGGWNLHYIIKLMFQSAAEDRF